MLPTIALVALGLFALASALWFEVTGETEIWQLAARKETDVTMTQPAQDPSQLAEHRP